MECVGVGFWQHVYGVEDVLAVAGVEIVDYLKGGSIYAVNACAVVVGELAVLGP